MAKRIFIVEDDDAIRESVIELMEMEGYAVDSAENGQVALDRLSSLPPAELPDLILLDLMMPIKDGFGFCAERALNRRLVAIPVVIMSADSQVNEKLARTNAVAAIKKPADIDDLLTIVKKHIK